MSVFKVCISTENFVQNIKLGKKNFCQSHLIARNIQLIMLNRKLIETQEYIFFVSYQSRNVKKSLLESRFSMSLVLEKGPKY